MLSTVDLLVVTSLDELLFGKYYYFLFSKQPTLMGRSIVLTLPPQLVFLGKVIQ